MKIGILGGGQLARMLAAAGIPAGLEFLVLDPAPDACAAALARHLQADWDDPAALAELAACDRVTCDFENVPSSSLRFLAGEVPVRPSAEALAAAQDRLHEKDLFGKLGLETPDFRPVSSRPDLAAAVDVIGLPAVLKTRRLGYDGKGQAILQDAEDLEVAWQKLGEADLILEQWIDFRLECAITATRSADGEIHCYPLTRTLHRGGILSLALAPIPGGHGHLQQTAETAVAALMEHLDYVGCLSLEFFLAESGLLANEFAPRVHNSAHWTIEGAVCSQFENHLRAVCDWPLGATGARGAALMINFIGHMPAPEPYLAVPGLHWHDYGKAPRAGRKVGHATLAAPDFDGLHGQVAALKGVVDQSLAADLDLLLAS